ncbi:hypothetical protein Tco_1462044, partial [Tanacetum coccineum]
RWTSWMMGIVGKSMDKMPLTEIPTPGARNSSHGNNNDDDNTMGVQTLSKSYPHSAHVAFGTMGTFPVLLLLESSRNVIKSLRAEYEFKQDGLK